MADALASGASVRKDVGVQVPPRPPPPPWFYWVLLEYYLRYAFSMLLV